MARLLLIIALCAASAVVAANAEGDEDFVVRTFFEHLASSMTQDSEAEETRASIAIPMLRSPAQLMSAAAALIDDVTKVEKHLSSDGYEKSDDEPDRFVVVGAPWFSAEDVLKDVQMASKGRAGAGKADIFDIEDDAAVAAVISGLNPRELSDRLNNIVEHPNVFADPWKHVKAFMRKRSVGKVTDDEVGLANAALSQVYDVLASILGVGVRSEHDAVHFSVFGYEKAGKSTLNFAITGWNVFPVGETRETRCPFQAEVLRVDASKVRSGDVRVLTGADALDIATTDSEDRYSGRWLSLSDALAKGLEHNRALSSTHEGFSVRPFFMHVESPDVNYTVIQVDTPGFMKPAAIIDPVQQREAEDGMALLDSILQATLAKPNNHAIVLMELAVNNAAASGDFFAERVFPLMQHASEIRSTVMRVYTKSDGFDVTVTPSDAAVHAGNYDVMPSIEYRVHLPVDKFAQALRLALSSTASDGEAHRWPWLINIPLLTLASKWNLGPRGKGPLRMSPAELYQQFLKLQDEDDTKRITALKAAAAAYPELAAAIKGYDLDKYLRFSSFLREYKSLVRAGVDAAVVHADGAVKTMLRALRRRASELASASQDGHKFSPLLVVQKAVGEWINKYLLLLKGTEMQTSGWVAADLFTVFNTDSRVIALREAAPMRLRYGSNREVGARQHLHSVAAPGSTLNSNELPTLEKILKTRNFGNITKQTLMMPLQSKMTTLDDLISHIGREAVRVFTSIFPASQHIGQFYAAAGQVSSAGGSDLIEGISRRAVEYVRIVWEHIAQFVVDQISIAHEIARVEVMRYLHNVHGTDKFSSTRYFFRQAIPSAMLHRAASLAVQDILENFRLELLGMTGSFHGTHHDKASHLQVDVLELLDGITVMPDGIEVTFGKRVNATKEGDTSWFFGAPAGESEESFFAQLRQDWESLTPVQRAFKAMQNFGDPAFWESEAAEKRRAKLYHGNMNDPEVKDAANALFTYQVVSLQLDLLVRLTGMLANIRESLMDMEKAYGSSLKHGIENYAMESVMQLRSRSPDVEEKSPLRSSKILLPPQDAVLTARLLEKRFGYTNPAGEMARASQSMRAVTEAMQDLIR